MRHVYYVVMSLILSSIGLYARSANAFDIVDTDQEQPAVNDHVEYDVLATDPSNNKVLLSAIHGMPGEDEYTVLEKDDDNGTMTIMAGEGLTMERVVSDVQKMYDHRSNPDHKYDFPAKPTKWLDWRYIYAHNRNAGVTPVCRQIVVDPSLNQGKGVFRNVYFNLGSVKANEKVWTMCEPRQRSAKFESGSIIEVPTRPTPGATIIDPVEPTVVHFKKPLVSPTPSDVPVRKSAPVVTKPTMPIASAVPSNIVPETKVPVDVPLPEIVKVPSAASPEAARQAQADADKAVFDAQRRNDLEMYQDELASRRKADIGLTAGIIMLCLALIVVIIMGYHAYDKRRQRMLDEKLEEQVARFATERFLLEQAVNASTLKLAGSEDRATKLALDLTQANEARNIMAERLIHEKDEVARLKKRVKDQREVSTDNVTDDVPASTIPAEGKVSLRAFMKDMLKAEDAFTRGLRQRLQPLGLPGVEDAGLEQLVETIWKLYEGERRGRAELIMRLQESQANEEQLKKEHATAIEELDASYARIDELQQAGQAHRPPLETVPEITGSRDQLVSALALWHNGPDKDRPVRIRSHEELLAFNALGSAKPVIEPDAYGFGPEDMWAQMMNGESFQKRLETLTVGGIPSLLEEIGIVPIPSSVQFISETHATPQKIEPVTPQEDTATS